MPLCMDYVVAPVCSRIIVQLHVSLNRGILIIIISLHVMTTDFYSVILNNKCLVPRFARPSVRGAW